MHNLSKLVFKSEHESLLFSDEFEYRFLLDQCWDALFNDKNIDDTIKNTTEEYHLRKRMLIDIIVKELNNYGYSKEDIDIVLEGI